MSIHDKAEVIRAAARTMQKAKDSLSDEYVAAEYALRHALCPNPLAQLHQLVEQGPVWDGNVISKSDRDELLTLGLASRVCVKGEQGYTAANYRGWGVLKAAEFKR